MTNCRALTFVLTHFDDVTALWQYTERPEPVTSEEWSRLQSVLNLASDQAARLLAVAIDGVEDALRSSRCRFEVTTRSATARLRWTITGRLTMPRKRRPHAFLGCSITNEGTPELRVWLTFASERRRRGREFAERLLCRGVSTSVADGRDDWDAGTVMLGSVSLASIDFDQIGAQTTRLTTQTVANHWGALQEGDANEPA